MANILRCVLYLVLSALCLEAQETPNIGGTSEQRGVVKHFNIPKGPIDAKSMEDIYNVASLDCVLVSTYDRSNHRQIAVKAVKIYKDKSTKSESINNVFSTRRDAMAACGAWQDQFESQWLYVHEITKIASH